MSLDTLNNGDSGLDARTKINAAIDAVNASTIIRGSGVLQGHTNPGSPENAPSDLSYNLAFDQEFLLFYTHNGTTYSFTISVTDPADSTIWIDSSGFSTALDPATAVAAAINALSIPGITASNAEATSQNCIVSDTNTGPAESHSGSLTNTTDPITVTGGGSGSSAVPPSGATSEVTIIPADESKDVKMIKAGVYNAGGGVNTTVQIALTVASTYYPIGAAFSAYTMTGEVAAGEFFFEWVTGRPAASVVARMTGEIPTGGALACWAVVEQR
jgi:hypothetical protein